ncbi:IS110 family transposase [Bordetella genomosp. 7]|uniref:IS110 family transposase n=1 Tax=Bordetella genomosp. 7 TaxID=1416805 RepID=A0A261RQF0_9BORD|nr:IS110 family transposase [Bordetella genomosp. 7]OZI27249.1 IS110 family transposase [Bordetella genomosp. 7]
MFFLGIDVSKAKLNCALIGAEGDKRKTKVVPNTVAGIQALLGWCAKQGAQPEQLHVVLEPSGPYHEQAGTALHDAGARVSMINPAQARDFAGALAVRTKTDEIDSYVLARYGQALRPPLWQPAPLHARQLRALLARHEALAKDLQRELNRQEKAQFGQSPEPVTGSIDQGVAFLTEQIKRLERAINDHIDRHPDLKEDRDLLTSIPAVGPQTGNALLSIMHNRRIESPQSLAAYLGLAPVQRQSGTSLNGRSRLSKTGPARVRATLYMAAVVAVRHNPHIQALYARLLAAGNSKMAALGAAMRKLVHLCFGVLKNRTPYRSDYALAT